jgi:hypothetical protein
MPPLGKEELDKVFCMNSKKYRIPKLILKSVAMAESSMMQDAFRHEPGFWHKYLKNNPEWKDKDQAVVSSSYGLMQLMWTTAWLLGFRGTQEDLYNPVINIELGAKLLRQIADRVIVLGYSNRFFWLSPLVITLARYNGGSYQNPDDNGNIRNQKYVDKVLRFWADFKIKEKECD